MELPMFCNSPDFTQPDPADRKKEVERTRDMFRVTAELGGKYCRVLSGQNRPGLNEAEALKWVIDCLWQLEPHAQAAGVVMCMENHYKDGLWQYPEFAQSHRRYLAILDAVDTPLLKAQYDPSNAIVAGEDAYELLDRVLPRVATMQASDRYLEGGTIEELKKMARDPQHGYAKFVKHGVIGKGLNDYDRIFGTLAKAGYSGWVSIEDGEGPTVEIGLDNLRQSAKFLREKFAKHFGGGGDE
jgi:sugar phosphate isomerase/epimerase